MSREGGPALHHLTPVETTFPRVYIGCIPVLCVSLEVADGYSIDEIIEDFPTLDRRNISVVIVPTNNLTILLANAIALRVTLDELAAHPNSALVTIDWRGRRTMRGLSGADEETKELPRVPPF